MVKMTCTDLGQERKRRAASGVRPPSACQQLRLVGTALLALAVRRLDRCFFSGQHGQSGQSRREFALLGSSLIGGTVAVVGDVPKSEAFGGLDLTPPPPRQRTYAEVVQEAGLEDWQLSDYEAMRDDVPRTSKFAAAIERRVKQQPDVSVVDIGTGPFALLALIAARAGAKQVFAIEKNVPAAKRAKQTVKEAGLEGKVKVIEGDSTQIELPERCDLVVSELIGSIATQEGVTPIIVDARNRFLKPEAASTGMIPARCQTCIAPIKYRGRSFVERFISPFQGLRSRGKPEPGTSTTLRIPASSPEYFELLSEPQILEDFDYNSASLEELRQAKERNLVFDVPAQEGLRFSGFALWPRVVVDSEDTIDVRTQPDSHWAYVVVRMLTQPVSLAVPSAVRLRASTDYSSTPTRYALEASVMV